MAYTREFLEEIKLRNSIEEVIGRTVTLKRAGGNLVGRCPFHSERTPSFTVFPSTSSYYCFGCGAGGDVVTFVMQTENLEYREAIEFLAKRAGIKVEETYEQKEKVPTVRRERMLELNREAARFFYKALLAPEGAFARNYLEKRQFQSATIKHFGIGYAPNAPYGKAPLCEYLMSKGFTPFELKSAFLGGEGKNGKMYDIFRHRVMFPVFDANGEVVAFSGRRLSDNEEERKYINTSDTVVFKKSKILFGLHIAKNTESGSLVLCEGAPDAIAMHQAGFDNAIATLGTAITPEHARTIARYCRTVYLAYDIDKAGRRATLKGIDLLNQVGVDTKIINLGTEAKDPDEFIKKFGANAFRAKLTGSSGQIDYRIDEILGRYDTTVAEEKLRAVDEVKKFIAELASRPEREVYSARAAEKLGLTAEAMRTEVERIYNINDKKAKKAQGQNALKEQSGFGGTANADKLRFSSEASHEEQILGLLLIRSDFGPEAMKRLSEDDFATGLNKKIFNLFKEEFSAGQEIVLSKDGVLTAREIGALENCRASRLDLGDITLTALNSHIDALKELRERSEYDKKIESDPANALSEYLNKLKKKKSDIQED
ncbi:MAG: DNA primase [Clostridia bacterium]|nr:DNA primase [Clostridia bacterium]MBR5278396.1 DNA primase [Clostridia bacterium]